MKRSPFWSVIVPAYNESGRNHVREILAYLAKRTETWELIIVNDGSTDDTNKELQKMNRAKKFRLISYEKNQGKGYAVKQGMLAATGEYRLFLDMDLSTPIAEMAKLRPHLGKYDVVIGTRKTKGAKVVVHQPWLRENLGKGFTLLSQLSLGVPVSDFTCGFKCFSAKVAQKVFSHAQINRWGFDAEILFLAHKYGYVIKEIPVSWTDDSRTRVKFPEDLVNSLSELIAIRVNDLTGKYHQ
ncbi:hypothetical protein A3A84_03635 [Candidatus Collierbacteria bacterium RIFCSPLOWO2_01_FULL_50_23]|uniref:dolichyl-phosphate beta-glucosyltransferase n=2 Tax=Candidatus Collieribacteriota TaxID=1752725 RepID=A0A1F5ETL9_9BACT|nr:MAG: hypothetical protein A3D09_03770 [Candidatus Collierbacteria bacterium RIFCSPHIGHO2_02_FULL_49_10]OGD71572.1 MAG: hypothetical protein A2703_02195 [Candidatus Collierbacteria bacterium RIFCSPHIGHO2_01_FULL_50_25]OGD74375.1 MAG: hypothetical protein A3A84_03635 [Candidatus Collierbacteria bacterium RIFCSPLOWO2_01_FULL_50_23]